MDCILMEVFRYLYYRYLFKFSHQEIYHFTFLARQTHKHNKPTKEVTKLPREIFLDINIRHKSLESTTLRNF